MEGQPKAFVTVSLPFAVHAARGNSGRLATGRGDLTKDACARLGIVRETQRAYYFRLSAIVPQQADYREMVTNTGVLETLSRGLPVAPGRAFAASGSFMRRRIS